MFRRDSLQKRQQVRSPKGARMRILVISQMFPGKRHPTSAIFFANLMKELVVRIDELIVVAPRPYIPKVFTKIKKRWARWYLDPMVSRESGIEIIRPYYPSFPDVRFEGLNGLLMQATLYRMIKNIIKTRGIEIILGYNMIPEGVAAVRLAKMFNLPAGFWAIGSDVDVFARRGALNLYLSRKTIEESHIVITESKDLENKIRSFSKKNLRIHTFYKGIDVENFENLPPKHILMNDLGLDRRRKYLLFVGRLIRDKGIYELADCFNFIARRYDNVDLILIGEEIEKNKMLTELVKHGVNDRVSFKSVMSHREVAKYMKACDVLVFPSWAEGLPNVVMEAMAAGLPVVATSVGGIPEILKHGVTGLSVPVRSVKKLTVAVLRILEDRELREKCAKTAQRLIIENFNVKKNVAQLQNLLDGLRNSGPLARG